MNFNVWERADVVDYFTKSTQLQSCERYLFDKYLHPGSLLDVGVGGGRTTPHLLQRMARYIGIDYSGCMVEACKAAYPNVQFYVMDASDLSVFQEQEFNHVVFSFNGLGYLPDDASRQRCLREFYRVLKPGGTLIFSIHNARQILQVPHVSGTTWWRAGWRCLLALRKTLWLLAFALKNVTFRIGSGYVVDPVHGGVLTHVSIPGIIAQELTASNFTLQEAVGSNFPNSWGMLSEPWIYYVAKKGFDGGTREL